MPASKPNSAVDNSGKKCATMKGKKENIIQMLLLLASKIKPNSIILNKGTGVIGLVPLRSDLELILLSV